jgi:hypothetical protein
MSRVAMRGGGSVAAVIRVPLPMMKGKAIGIGAAVNVAGRL